MLFEANRSHLEPKGLIRQTVIQRIEIDNRHIVELLCPQLKHRLALTFAGLEEITDFYKKPL